MSKLTNISSSLEDFFYNSCQGKESSNGYIHFPCPLCGEALGRSGVYLPKVQSVYCFQPSCPTNTLPNAKRNKSGTYWIWAPYYIQSLRGDKELSNTLKFLSSANTSDKEKVAQNASNKLAQVPKKAKRVTLPKGCRKIRSGHRTGKRAREYLKGRGFRLKYLEERFLLYYQPKGTCKYYGRIIIPFRDYTGGLVYFQARAFLGGLKRWNNPEYDAFYVGSSDYLYNEFALSEFEVDVAWIMEGAADVWEISRQESEQGFGLNRKTISIDQLSTLNEHFYNKEIVIGLDAGAYLDGLMIARDILMVGEYNVRVLALEKGDANELGEKYMKKLRDNTPILSIDEIYHEINSVERRGTKTYKGKDRKFISFF